MRGGEERERRGCGRYRMRNWKRRGDERRRRCGLRRGGEGGRDWKTKMDERKTMAGQRAAAEWKRKKSSGANSEELDCRDCKVTKKELKKKRKVEK